MASLNKQLDVLLQVRRIKKQLEATVQACAEPVEQTLFTQASLIGSEIKATAPIDPNSETPGALKESVRVEVGAPTSKKAYVVKIKAGGEKTDKNGAKSKAYDYARGVEFGTEKAAAKPFFYPLWRARRKDVRAAVKTAIKRAVKDVFK